MDFSIIIPCYRSFNTLGSVIQEIKQVMNGRAFIKYEIILVNDNSPDNTWEKICELCEKYDEILGVDLAKNFGQASALMAGFSVAKGKYIITAEDDGQSSVELIWDMYDQLDADHDIICARNITNPKRGFSRTIGRKINQFVLDYVLEKPSGVSPSIFFVAKRCVIEEMLKYDKPYPYIGGLILRSTSKIGNYDVNRKQRISGESGYTIKKLVNLLLNGVTALSIKPLRISFGLSLIYACLFLVILIVWLVRKCLGIEILNNNLIYIGLFIAIISSVLFCLSIIGEYVGRIYMCINREPQFVIRQFYSREVSPDEINDTTEIQ